MIVGTMSNNISYADRLDHVGRFVGEERYLDRRVRFGTSSYGYEYHMGCRIRSRRPFASDLDDLMAMVVGLLPMMFAFG